MFIRKKRNRSGTTSIVVVEKLSDKFKELKTIGVSSDDAEIVSNNTLTLNQVDGKWVHLDEEITLTAYVMKGNVKGDKVILKPIVFKNPLDMSSVSSDAKAALKNDITKVTQRLVRSPGKALKLRLNLKV